MTSNADDLDENGSSALVAEGDSAAAGRRPLEPATPGLDELGQRIRRLRVEQRMTLKQVEERSGLSATHLSEIERGRTSPTIGALTRIARSLGRSPSYFVESEERSDIAHRRREDATPIHIGPGVVAECLTPGIPGSELCAYRVCFENTPSGEWTLPAQDIAGDALLYVTRGTIEAAAGETRVTLAAGDAMHASLTTPHRLRGASQDAEVLAVLTRSVDERK